MQKSFGSQTSWAKVRSWFARAWQVFTVSIGDPVDRLVGPPPWEKKRSSEPRTLRS